LYDQSGAPLAQVRALRTRPVSAEQMAGAMQKQDGLLSLQWREAGLPEAEPSQANGDSPNASEDIATIGEIQLQGAESYPSISALSEASAQGAQAPKAVLCQPKQDPDNKSPKAARKTTEEALETARQWIGTEGLASSRLALLTKGAIAISAEESPNPAT